MDGESAQSLFRGEVQEARRSRVAGEVVLSQPVRTHILVALLFGTLTLLGIWTALGTYTRSETARGILVTQDASTKIVAIRSGQIAHLFVAEGDHVRAGQRLAIIRTEQADEVGSSAIGQSMVALESQQRLATDQVALSGRRAASERARLTALLDGLRQQRNDVGSQMALQQEVVASTSDMVERISGLVDRGFISRVEFERRRQAHIVARQDLARLAQQHNALAAEGARTAAELSRVAVEAESETTAVRSSVESFALQRARLRGERAYTLIAPRAGRVTSLQAAVGRTADALVPLMEIVPEGSPLVAQVYAPTRAIGFVRPGQDVRLLYDAFPYQRFGSFSGRIRSISRTVIDPRQLAAPLGVEEPVYRIEVVPDAQTVAAFESQMPLQSGMTLTANIILDRRSFLEWLLSPLNSILRRNGEPG